MKYIEREMKSSNRESAVTELLYEIAAARAEGAELIRFNICKRDSDEDDVYPKIWTSIVRTLKGMKKEGRIQFFASKDSFMNLNTEAVFLINKYSDLFKTDPSSNNKKDFIYVKL